MTQNTETDIHIYNPTCLQLDGIGQTQHHQQPQNGRQDGKHAENNA